jgi:hypothetical protein
MLDSTPIGQAPLDRHEKCDGCGETFAFHAFANGLDSCVRCNLYVCRDCEKQGPCDDGDAHLMLGEVGV